MRTGGVSVEVVDRLDSLEGAWEELAVATSASPFLYPGWIRAWRTWFGGGALRVVVARRSGGLAGLVPLELRHGVLRSPTNSHTPAFDLVAGDAEAAGAVAQGVLSTGARRVELGFLDGAGLGLEALRSAVRSAGQRQIVRIQARAPYVRLPPSQAAYHASLSRNLRHDAERRLRRLCEAGAVSVEIADGGERLDALLDEAFGVERLGWKGARGTAIASRPELHGFYTDVARWAVERGWLRLAFLRLDGRPIAVQFDLEVGATYYSLKIGYDPAYERFAPGKLLAYAMVARAVAAGAATYELLGRDEEWKHRFTARFRERVAFSAFPRSPAGLLSWSARAYGRPIARRVRSVGTVRR